MLERVFSRTFGERSVASVLDRKPGVLGFKFVHSLHCISLVLQAVKQKGLVDGVLAERGVGSVIFGGASLESVLNNVIQPQSCLRPPSVIRSFFCRRLHPEAEGARRRCAGGARRGIHCLWRR